MKNTKQKEAIISAVREMKNHPTADEIYTYLKKDNERLSLGTVYRNLNRFVEKGEITKVTVPELSDCFDYRTDNHEHLLCEKCGKVFDIDTTIDIDNIIRKNSTIKVNGYKLMLYGVCSNCR